MGKGRFSGRLCSRVVNLSLAWLLAVAGLAVVTEPVGASAEPPNRVPTLDLPGTVLPDPSIPKAEGALSVPLDWNSPTGPARSHRTMDKLPERGPELVAGRNATTEVFGNKDGTETVVLHAEPVHFQPDGSASWQKIDNSIVPDPARPGWVRNRANDWIVSFGPIASGGSKGGIELKTDKGLVRFTPEGVPRTVTPRPGTGDKANTVTYNDVWPGVDIVYTVSAIKLKEDIVVHTGADRASFPFLVEGLGLSTDPAQIAKADPAAAAAADKTKAAGRAQVPHEPVVTGPQAGTVTVLPLEVAGGRGQSVSPRDSRAALAVEPAANRGAAQRVVVSVDQAWLKSEAKGRDTVTIDPSLGLGASAWRSTKVDPTLGLEEYSCGLGEYCPLRVGNSKDSVWIENGDAFWHTAGTFPYWNPIQGKKIVHAGLWLDHQTGGLWYEQDLVSLWAGGPDLSYGGAVCHGNPACFMGDQWPGVTSGPGYPPDAVFDLTEWLSWRQFLGATDPGQRNIIFGFSGWEEQGDTGDEYSLKQFDDVAMVLVLNTPPPAPGLVTPADGSLAIDSLTPTLKWNTVDDADGHEVRYTVKIGTDPNAEGGLVATSPELAESGATMEWTVPNGVLQDGVTYYWKVFAHDVNGEGGGIWTPSQIRKLTVDRRLGSGGLSPMDTFGDVTTNLVTGNAALAVAGPKMPTGGGGIGVNFVYTGQQRRPGLVAVYREDKDRDGEFDPDDPVKLVRTDQRIQFNWSETAPGPAVPTDFFLVRWAGSIRFPATGRWVLGARSDDGTRIRIDGSQVLNDWTGPGDLVYQTSGGPYSGTSPHQISIDYFEHSGPAYVDLWAKNLDNGQEFVVPEDWLTPDQTAMPAGWLLSAADANATYIRAEISEGSVTLIGPDGSMHAFSKQSGGYKAPEGIEDILVVNGDGTITVHSDQGYTYVFGKEGGLESVTTARDDRRPAAARNYYDSSGRLTEILDPVSGRKVTFEYASANAYSTGRCQEDAPIFGGAEFDKAPDGQLCQVNYWDGGVSRLYYEQPSATSPALLAMVQNPGAAYWGFSYDTDGRIARFHDPLGFDALWSGARTDSDTSRFFTQLTYTGTGPTSRVTSVTLPAALQTDTQRPQRTYAYAPRLDGGILLGGTATVTRAGVTGAMRTVGYDHRGRTTTETNAVGRTSTTHWDDRDLQIATETPDGLMTATVHNERNQPTDVWGPAPKDRFYKVWYLHDFWLPKDEYKAQIPHRETKYDEGISGLQVRFWNGVGFAGIPVLHQYNPDMVREGFPDGSLPGVNAENVSARLTGDIVFPEKGDYWLQICAGANELAALYIDGYKVTEVWAVPDLKCSGQTPWPYHVENAGETRQIQIDYVDLAGDVPGATDELLHLNWTHNGQYGAVPGTAFKPGYNLATDTIDADGKKTHTDYVDAASGIGPEHELVTRTTVDPGGLNLTATVGYEPAGGSAGFLRALSRTLPAGPASRTTNEYYPTSGAGKSRDNPCTAASDPADQGGMARLVTSADPDGAGSQTALKEEKVYDAAGRIVATRKGSGAFTDTSPAWTCTTYDARGRVTEVRYPAYLPEPARIVTKNYVADPDGSGPKVPSPMVTSVADASGTIIVETDLLGRVISNKDALGYTTTAGYDLAGRETTSNGPVGQLAKTYDNADRLTALKRDQLTVAEGIGYDSAGRLKSVSYPTGSGKSGNGTTGAFDYDNTGRLAKVTWTGPGGALITSDQVGRNKGGDVTDQVVDGIDHHAGNDYGYDAAGRLVDAWLPGRRLQYDYFQNGFCIAPDSYKNTNRTGMTVTPTGGSATQTHYCYDHADRLNSATDPAVGTITYDSRGNTATIFGETHTYDVADRHMTTAKNGTTVAYVRDATDRIIARKVNGAVVARYGSTGSGDAPAFTTNAAGQVLEVTYVLPGGAMLTTRASNVWSYPNIHGDVVAVANQAGLKQGGTTRYDPFGNHVGGALPDNSTGNLDYGWLGQNQRPLEHEPNLQPVIEMGARQYSPLLGRFLEVDPEDGGSANEYEYANGDPVNVFDLDGRGTLWKNKWFAINCSWGSCTLYLSKRLVRALASVLPGGWDPHVPGATSFCGKSKKGFSDVVRRAFTALCAIGLAEVLGGFMKKIDQAADKKSCVQFKFSYHEIVQYGITTSMSGGAAGALAAITSELNGAKVSDSKSKCHSYWKS